MRIPLTFDRFIRIAWLLVALLALWTAHDISRSFRVELSTPLLR